MRGRNGHKSGTHPHAHLPCVVETATATILGSALAPKACRIRSQHVALFCCLFLISGHMDHGARVREKCTQRLRAVNEKETYTMIPAYTEPR